MAKLVLKQRVKANEPLVDCEQTFFIFINMKVKISKYYAYSYNDFSAKLYILCDSPHNSCL